MGSPLHAERTGHDNKRVVVAAQPRLLFDLHSTRGRCDKGSDGREPSMGPSDGMSPTIRKSSPEGLVYNTAAFHSIHSMV